MSGTAARRLDAVGASVLTTGYLWLLLASVFSRREWADTIAYGLPGANLVRFGALAMPQLGTQFGFDRFWLFNAPWVVVAEVPTFWLTGAGRIPHLTGIALFGLVNWIVFTAVCRRLFDMHSVTGAMLIAFAFLDTRGLVTSDLYNQKYSVVAYALLLVAFLPVTDPRGACGRPWWQWLAAGLLPLTHIVLPPAGIIWFVTVVTLDRSVRGRSMLGPVLFVIAGLASAAWYLRPEPLSTQLWPHVAFGGFREAGHFSGLFDVAASMIAAIPTWTLAVATVVAAVVVAVYAWRGTSRTEPRDDALLAVPAVALILSIFVVDAWRGYLDYGYFLTGVGPIVFAAAATAAGRRALVAVLLAGAGIVNIAVSTRLDRLPPDWTPTTATEQFLTAHTRADDRIVVGPPFVFAAAAMPPARTIPRVIPQPYFLATFDRSAWRADLNACCNVYVGEEEQYTRLARPLGPAREPIFADADIEHVRFNGQPVIVARRR